MNASGMPDDAARQVAFGVTVFREPPAQLADCLSRVRAVYPRALVFVISDGNDDPRYGRICRQHDAGCYRGERLKVGGYGAIWWQRFFEIALAHPADFVFKMDADTRLHRAFAHFPDWDVFGTVERDFEIQGGMQGFRRSAARRIVDSGICLDPLYRDVTRWGAEHCVRYTQNTGQISSDHSMAHMVRRLGLTWGDWDEVDCQWRHARPFRAGVAASHPHKGPGNSRSSQDDPAAKAGCVGERWPKVSCAIVTQESRWTLLPDALRCFRSQNYPDLELVIVYGGPADFAARLAELLARLDVDPASVVQVACAPDLPLGAARNLSVLHSRGELVCQWDDDDLYHPDRVRAQAQALLQAGADACFLAEQYHHFTRSNEVYLRREARIHGTAMFRRSVACRYPEQGPNAVKGEDTVFMRCLDEQCQVVIVRGRPELYLRRYHGGNTWDADHHRRLAQQTLSRSSLLGLRGSIERHLGEFGLRGTTIVGLDGAAFDIP